MWYSGPCGTAHFELILPFAPPDPLFGLHKSTMLFSDFAVYTDEKPQSEGLLFTNEGAMRQNSIKYVTKYHVLKYRHTKNTKFFKIF